jgi:hypothetical protein
MKEDNKENEKEEKEKEEIDYIKKYRLGFKEYITEKLVEEYPAKLKNENKIKLWSISCNKDTKHNGKIEYSRFSVFPLPKIYIKDYNKNFKLIMEENSYPFTKQKEDSIEWHVNFSHSQLFVAYGSHFFAQDEILVAEHPSLGSLCECLFKEEINTNLKPKTKEGKFATPILIQNIEKKIKFKIDVNSKEGR